MADTKTSALTAITGAGTATGDLFLVLDVSDTTQGPGGTLKTITRAELLSLGFDPASPGAIGGTTPAAVTATTLDFPGNNAGYTSVITFGTTGIGPAYIKNYNRTDLEFGVAGAGVFSIDSSGPYFAMLYGAGIVYSSGAHGSKDVGHRRNAAGVLEVNNGTAGTFRDLKLRTLIATERIDNAMYTTATRPAFTNGATIFDSDLDKLLSGGAAGWEVVTSV